jgi:arylsulfatase A-like enzyme
VLFVAVDDLNDWIGCLGGHPDALTPNLDRLAARGTLFSNAHCQAPICGPSRASLLSGRYPHSTGVYQQPSKTQLMEDKKNFRGKLLPQSFAAAGYHTLGGGKITHGMSMKEVFQTVGPGQSFGPFPPGKKRISYEPDLSVPYSGTMTDWGAFPERDDQMPDHEIAAWAVEVLQQPQEKPFFLAVGFMRPHVPFTVPQKWFDLFDAEKLSLPEMPVDELAGVPETGRAVHAMPRYPQREFLVADDRKELRKCVHAYLACVAFVDAQMGKVLDALDAGPHTENTVVVLFGDHGYHLGEKHRVCKHGLWEEATKVPLIVVPPKGNAGQISSKPVGLIDLYPTLLELAGLPTQKALEGMSLVPLLADPAAAWRESVLTTYGKKNHALRGERYRYIRYVDGSEELYDHQQDEQEWMNLASLPERAPLLKQFRKQLPDNDAAHHPSTRTAAVNPWFEAYYEKNNLEKN